MRLIDADALNVRKYTLWFDEPSDVRQIERMIRESPTIEAAPVVRGRWITNSDYPDTVICSLCGWRESVWWADKGTNYCPNCEKNQNEQIKTNGRKGGAVMKLEDCTKEELIHIIRCHCFYNIDELEFDILIYRSKTASKLSYNESKTANDAIGEYIELLKPYQGNRITDVPMEVLKKASNAQNRYEKHTAKSESYQKQYDKIQRQIDENLNDKGE